MTIVAMRALRASERRVPKNIAPAAFDDLEWAACFEPRLTVIAQACDYISRRVKDLLLGRIKNPNRKARTIRLDAELRIRSSYGCL